MIHHAGELWRSFFYLREVKVRRSSYIYTYAQSKILFHMSLFCLVHTSLKVIRLEEQRSISSIFSHSFSLDVDEKKKEEVIISRLITCCCCFCCFYIITSCQNCWSRNSSFYRRFAFIVYHSLQLTDRLDDVVYTFMSVSV
jgi:hypothetical protein